MSDVSQQSDPLALRAALRGCWPPAQLLLRGILQRNGYRNRGEFSGKAKIGQALEQTICLLLL